MGFGADLAVAMDKYGPLSVGVDPSPEMLAMWGIPDSAEGLLQFGQSVIDACDQEVAVVKFQIAFFERHGARGFSALEQVLEAARGRGILTIMDAKRGDIGSTMSGYADAFLRPGAPLEAHALTVSPYLGFGALQPALDLAAQHGKGVFVLCLTSNPEGASVQHARDADGVAVSAAIATKAAEINAGAEPMGDIGLVVGATTGDAARALSVPLAAVNGPLLAPGVGAQGAGATELADVFGAARGQVLAHQSRGVLQHGPFGEKLRDAVRHAADQARQALRGS